MHVLEIKGKIPEEDKSTLEGTPSAAVAP